MKVIHVPFCYHPDPVGGTEVYVESLAHSLQDLGTEVLVAAPGATNQSYQHHQLQIRRYAHSAQVNDISELYGDGDPLAAKTFDSLLEQESPDVVHIHAFTRSVSLRQVRAAKARNIPVVFTYHTPTVSCQRGTLLRWGNEVCDGRLNIHTCASCALDGLGLNRSTAQVVGALPASLGRSLGRLGLKGRACTALRMTEMVGLRHAAFHALAAEVDRMVALCDWVRQLLLLNDVPAGKITLCRYGLQPDEPIGPQSSASSASAPRLGNDLRIVFLGRLDPTKGIHVLVEAFRLRPSLQARLDIYGIVQGTTGQEYADKLKEMARSDCRISFLPPVPSDRVVSVIANYDLLAVPSQWLESGPLVVLEAFSAGVPVIGSRLGGIEELVSREVDGLLLDPSNPSEWARAFEQLAADGAQLERLRMGVQRPRSNAKVAEEMITVYSGVIASGSVLQPLSP